MATPQTVCAETTATLVKPSPLNPLRRLFRKPVPTYTTHLFADAVVAVAGGGSDQLPTLSIETKTTGQVFVILTWPTPAGGTVQRVSVRERGANRPWRKAGLVQVHPKPLEDVVREAVTAGQITPNAGRSVLAGDMTMGEAFAAGAVVRTRADLPGGGLVQTMTATTPEGTASLTIRADAFHTPLPPLAHRFTPLPGEPATPTESTTVLHDLAFIADQLELAQTQVAMSDGGVGAGSMDNGAHVALCALRMVQAKLEVVADAADLAVGEVIGAQARLEGSLVTPQLKGCLNRSRAMLRQVTTALPHAPKESARGTV